MPRDSTKPPATAPGAITLTGDDALVRALLALPDRVFVRVLTTAARKAMRPVIAQARAAVPRESGQLAKSIGVKLRKYPRRGVVVAIVGARLGFGTEYAGRRRDPLFYSHLVELGHQVVAKGSLKTGYSRKVSGIVRRKGTGRTIGRVAPRPFLLPALTSNQVAVVGELRRLLRAGIAREWQRSGVMPGGSAA